METKLILVTSTIIILGIVVLAALIFNNSSNINDNSNIGNNIIQKNSEGSFRDAMNKIIGEKMANRQYWEVIDDIINCERKDRDKDGTEESPSYGQPETQDICSDYEGKSLTFVNVQIASESDVYSIVETKYGINFTLPLKGNIPSPMQTSKKWTIGGVVEKDSYGHFLNVKNTN